MTKLLAILLLAWAGVVSAQSGTFPALVGQRGATTPTNCTVGQLFWDSDATAGTNLYGCTSANTWTLMSGAGSGIAIGEAVTSGTAASVLFVATGPVLAQDNTNFAYTTSSGPRLQVGSTGTSTGMRLGYGFNSGEAMIWNSTYGLTPAASEYALLSVTVGSGLTLLNAPDAVHLRVANTSVLTVAAASITAAQPITGVSGVTAWNATAIPAGGTAGSGYKFSSTANFGIFFGSGAPSLAAAKGSLYLRSDGSGVADRAYINTDGNTTWTAIATAG